jgi:hypothetical protein
MGLLLLELEHITPCAQKGTKKTYEIFLLPLS